MSADQLTLLAVDDERPVLEDLARLLRAAPGVGAVECAADGREALHRITRGPYDGIFLDVRMPDLDGLELARVLRNFAQPPQLVFVSAHDEAAVEAFELRALDYLRKPVGRARVLEAVERVADAVAATESALGAEPVRARATRDDEEMVAVANLHGGGARLLPRSAIEFVQSYGDFVRIVSGDERFLLRATLADIERRWEPFGFVRVHRQYVANLRAATELRPQLGGTAELRFPGGRTVPVARRHSAELARRLAV
ncbi:MAG TPA: LytTR family DNA-binding domain-containing protein [Solirubrobacteraceae bacterium]|nr:LytTR family DNA-binding domain-containing protein [Solirubrobacteraceae bacterium]